MIQFDLIRAHDPELCGYMEEELARQRSHLELIASENFVSETVMARNMQMSSPIPAHRRTFPFILRFLTPAIRFSA